MRRPALDEAVAEQVEIDVKYAGYVVREVNVSADAPPVGIMPMARGKVMMAQADAGEALPVEAGKGTVTATVSGSVQMK